MRIWLVPFHELDNARLAAQLTDWHRIARAFRLGRDFQGWERQEYYDAFLAVRHRLIVELTIRDLNIAPEVPDPLDLHNRPPPHIPQYPYPIHPDARDQDRWTLYCRWGGEFQGRMIAPDDQEVWEAIADRYTESGGCSHGEGVNAQGLCDVCKRAKYVNGRWYARDSRALAS